MTHTDPARLRRWTLTAVLIATAILMLDIAVVATAVPDIADDLDTDLHALKWVLDAYTLALAGLVLTAGSLADRIGRRAIFVVGLSVFTLSSLAASLAPTVEVLVAARAAQGIGAAAMFAVSLALIADVFPAGPQRGAAIAAYAGTIGASFAAGPLAGGALTTLFGWRAVFLVNVPIGIAGIVIATLRLRESRDPVPRGVDVIGQATLVVALFALVFGLLDAADSGWGEPSNLAAFAVAALSGLGFVVTETRVAEPMVPLGMLRRPRFASAQLVAFAISAGLYAIFAYLMVYYQGVLGLSAIQAGLLLAPAMVLNLLVAAASGAIQARLGTEQVIGLGMAFATAGLVAMTLADADSAWWVTLPGLSLANVGAGLINPAISSLSLEVPPEHSGLAVGIHDTARQAGMTVGVAVLGALLPVSAGDGLAFVDGLVDALWVGAAITATGGVGAVALLHRRAPRAAPAFENA